MECVFQYRVVAKEQEWKYFGEFSNVFEFAINIHVLFAPGCDLFMHYFVFLIRRVGCLYVIVIILKK